MTSHPILFSAPMVRALLAGTKTQTRRAVKLQTGDTFDEHALVGAIQEWRPVFDKVAGCNVGRRAALIRCPYGKTGDRLWVRETWGTGSRPDPFEGCVEGIEYRADEAYIDDIEYLPLHRVKTPDDVDLCDYPSGWRPSIHMPRWASRITLEVTGVRVERLQDISEADALAEGIEAMRCPDCHLAGYGLPGWGHIQINRTAREAYAFLWESINGEGSWDANPYVWVVEFRRLTP